MDPTNKPYIIIGSSVCTGILLAWISKLVRDHLKKEKQEKKIIDLRQNSEFPGRKRIERKKSLPPSYNRIKLSVNSKFDSSNSLVQELNFLDTPTCEIFKVNHLAWDMEMYDFPNIVSPLMCPNVLENTGNVCDSKKFLPESSFVFMNSFTLSVAFFSDHIKMGNSARWLRAGPRKHLFFDPKEVKACILTCGMVCPGTNVVVQEITNSLYNNYNVRNIYGVKFGFRGFYMYDWIELNPAVVESIHHEGGMFLGTSRGGFIIEKILNALVSKGINQVYIIGGLGSLQGSEKLYKEIKERKLKISINIVPKTMNNDIPLFDTYFGFESCVEKANAALKGAYNEIHSYEYGVVIVKLVGRQSGFLAVEASMAFRDVNFCLIPEIGYELYGEKGLLNCVLNKVKANRYCIIVVAEGAGDSLLDDILPDRGTDESGNLKPGDIGLFLQEKIHNYASINGMNIKVKYTDPTFLIRSVEPNALDTKIATRIAQNVVHCAMAGFTGYCTGITNKNTVIIPVSEMLSDRYAQSILPNDPNWQRLLSFNKQPSFINDETIYLKDSKKGEKININ